MQQAIRDYLQFVKTRPGMAESDLAIARAVWIRETEPRAIVLRNRTSVPDALRLQEGHS